MMPEEITALLATAATTIQTIASQPMDDDLTVIRNILYHLLLDIPYDKDGMHNLIGLIEPTASYTTTWGAAFPQPNCLPAYLAIPDDASDVVRAHCAAEHAILVKDYVAYNAVERVTEKNHLQCC